MKKKLLIFCIAYIVIYIPLSFLIFSWNAFGGSNNTNLFQKTITFFFTFPSSLVLLKTIDVLLFPFIDAVFWTIIFYLCLLLFYQFKKIF